MPEHRIVGWEGAKFGDGFDAALGHFSQMRWTGYSIETCERRMPLDGCVLHADSQYRSTPLIEGITFVPAFTFDKVGKLRSISLNYASKEPTNDECIELMGRSIDRLVKDYGQLHIRQNTDKLPPGWTRSELKSGSGFLFNVESQNPGHEYVSNVFRTGNDSGHKPYVSIFSSYIIQSCNVYISIDDGTDFEVRQKPEDPAKADPQPVATPDEVSEYEGE